MHTRVGWVVLAGLLVAAQGPDDAPKEQAKLEGTWHAVAGEQAGRKHDDAREHFLVFHGNTFTMRRGDMVMLKGTYKIDPAKKPREIDLTVTEGPDVMKGKTSPGVYELEGDTLKWASGTPGGTERPKEFGSTAGTPFMLITLKRQTK